MIILTSFKKAFDCKILIRSGSITFCTGKMGLFGQAFFGIELILSRAIGLDGVLFNVLYCLVNIFWRGVFKKFAGIIRKIINVSGLQAVIALNGFQVIMDGEIAEILAAFSLGQPFPITFMLEIWEKISPFVQTDIDRPISVAHFEIIGDRVGCEGIDVRLNASDNQIVKYVSIE